MMSLRAFLVAPLAALLIASAGLALADLYRWVDENGQVHYSDMPPPPNARTSKALHPSRAEPPAGAAKPSKSYVEKEAEFQKRQAEKAEQQAQQEKKMQEAEAKKRNCEQARSQLAQLQAGGRITRFNAQGEREFLNEQQIQSETEAAKKAVADWCK